MLQIKHFEEFRSYRFVAEVTFNNINIKWYRFTSFKSITATLMFALTTALPPFPLRISFFELYSIHMIKRGIIVIINTLISIDKSENILSMIACLWRKLIIKNLTQIYKHFHNIYAIFTWEVLLLHISKMKIFHRRKLASPSFLIACWHKGNKEDF